MTAPRIGTYAVRLADGTVLAVGSQNSCTPGYAWGDSVQAELFDPATGAWTEVASLGKPRDYFVAEPLRGGALVAGGVTDVSAASGARAYSSTTIFDPVARRWTASGLLGTARMGAAGARLADGRILVAGGRYMDGTFEHETALRTAEVYEPGSGRWSPTGSMRSTRVYALSVTLADGRVLVAGDGMYGVEGATGTGAGTAEIYDPATATWTLTGSFPQRPRDFGYGLPPSMVALPDGGALLLGATSNGDTLRLDPRSLVWRSTPPMLVPADARAAAVLQDGRVLVAGGIAGAGTPSAMTIRDAEIYDPARDAWTRAASLPADRAGGSAVVLRDGSVLLFAGGRFRLDQSSGDTTPWCPGSVPEAVRFIPG